MYRAIARNPTESHRIAHLFHRTSHAYFLRSHVCSVSQTFSIQKGLGGLPITCAGMPSVVAGCLHPSNVRHVIDWNEKGVIAYACHNLIILVDAFTNRRVQVVDLHSAAINNIVWCPSSALSVTQHDQDDLRIASSDISGQIFVCEAFAASRISQFSLSSTTVHSMSWFVWKDMSRDFLLVLHSGSNVVLWNGDSGEKVWSYQYQIPLYEMSLDPFNTKRAAFSSNGGSVLLVSDLNLNTPPTSSGNLIRLNSEESAKGTSSVLVIRHHRAYRNVLFVSTHNTMYCIDPELCCVFSKIALDGTLSVIAPCSSRDAVYTVSVAGTIQLRVGKYTSNDDRADAQLEYDRILCSDTQRQAAHSRVVAAAVCPVSQTTVALLYNNGRMIFWQLESDVVSSMGRYRTTFVDDFLAFRKDLLTTPIGQLRLRQTGICGALSSGVSCVRVRPLDGMGEQDGEDPFRGKHLAAVGTHSGSVHLVDIFSSQIVKEFNIQSSPIRCVEWASPHTFLTAGYNHALSTSQVVRNDVFAMDIRTGVARRVRPEADETPITMIRVSFYQSYLAIAFQREPLEIWDIKNMRLLRKMSRACPLIVDMSWSCKHCNVKTTEQSGQAVYRENLVVLDSDNRLYHIVVKGLHVRDGKEVNTQWKSGGWSIRCMAWKDDVLAMGDADGRLAVWDLAKRSSRHTRAERSPVIRMQFSRLAGDHTLAVLHQKELILWDTETLTRIQSVSMDGNRSPVDMDLCGVSPVIVTNDNMMRYAPSAVANVPLTEKELPILISEPRSCELALEFAKRETTFAPLQDVMKRLQQTSDDAASQLHNELLISRWMGDGSVANLLQVVLSVLAPERDHQLPPHLQMFWENAQFKERELRVICACCRLPDALESRVVERAVVAGGKARERAVDRLIGASSGDLRMCSLKAALLVSQHDGEQAKSLIKLIATNLIANDMIEDGVELLFLVGAGSDACKYLQSQRQWNKSVVYGKMGLSEPDDVLQKWISHLSLDQKSKCVLAHASIGQWPNTVEMLSTMGRNDLARLVLRTSTEIVTAEHTPESEKSDGDIPSGDGK